MMWPQSRQTSIMINATRLQPSHVRFAGRASVVLCINTAACVVYRRFFVHGSTEIAALLADLADATSDFT